MIGLHTAISKAHFLHLLNAGREELHLTKYAGQRSTNTDFSTMLFFLILLCTLLSLSIEFALTTVEHKNAAGISMEKLSH